MLLEDVFHLTLRRCRPSRRHLNLLNAEADLWSDRLGTRLPGEATMLRPIPFGSTSRGTATAPINDCDRILLLDLPRDAEGRPAASAREVIEQITLMAAEGLEALRWDGHGVPYSPRAQGHSVGLRHKFGWAHLDIVPMVPARGSRLQLRPEVALLPELRTDRWIEVQPFEHRSRLVGASAEAPDLLGAITLIKVWKRQRELPLPSIAIEHLMMSLCPGAASLQALVLTALGVLGEIGHSAGLAGVPDAILANIRPEQYAEIARVAWDTAGALRSLLADVQRGIIDEGAAEYGVGRVILGDRHAPIPEDHRRLGVESDPWREGW